MTPFIILSRTGTPERPIAINPAHVATVFAVATGNGQTLTTEIRFIDGSSIWVKGDLLDVVAKINGTVDR